MVFPTIRIHNQAQKFAVALQLLRQDDPLKQFRGQSVNRSEVCRLRQIRCSHINSSRADVVQFVQVRVQQEIHGCSALQILHHEHLRLLEQCSNLVPLTQVNQRNSVLHIDVQRTIGVVAKVQHHPHGVGGALKHDRLVDIHFRRMSIWRASPGRVLGFPYPSPQKFTPPRAHCNHGLVHVVHVRLRCSSSTGISAHKIDGG
mmetsp:Transcript_14714/g.32050  ORF Transcript_14714/g.32050 Transcript_14714/m.32050 type:complete len:202 (-) Transcript_14714:1678-2283(-)